MSGSNESAALRSLADQVASPVVAGRKSRRGLSTKQRTDWGQIIDVICEFPKSTEAFCELARTCKATSEQRATGLAVQWKELAKTTGIGYTKPLPVVGWMFAIPGFWSIFLPMLIELAKLWIESRNRQQEQQQ